MAEKALNLTNLDCYREALKRENGEFSNHLTRVMKTVDASMHRR
jgi:hypothetical protein